MTSREMLSKKLADLMEAARLSYLRFLQSQNIPAVVTVQQLAIVDTEGNASWQSEMHECTVSTAENYLPSWTAGFRDEFKEAALDLAADFVAAFAATLPFWAPTWAGIAHQFLDLSPEGSDDFRSEPNHWTARHIIVPAVIEYLRSLNNLETPEPALASRIGSEALDLAGSSKLKLVSYLPVYGLDTESDRLTAGEIVVRKLTPLERGALWNQGHSPPIISRNMLYYAQYSHLAPSHVIEVSVTRLRMKQPQAGSDYQAALCAFYLHGYLLAGAGMVTSDTVPEWISFGRMGTPVRLSGIVRERKALNQDSLNGIWQTLKKLQNYNVDQPSSPRDLALHRFLLGSMRESSADSLLDYAIAMECIFLPYDPSTRQSELSYRFRLHGAHYVGSSINEKREIWKQLRDIYEIRSRLVHGSEYPTPSEISEVLEIARRLASKALLKAVRSHFPRVEEFNTLVLEGTAERG